MADFDLGTATAETLPPADAVQFGGRDPSAASGSRAKMWSIGQVRLSAAGYPAAYYSAASAGDLVVTQRSASLGGRLVIKGQAGNNTYRIGQGANEASALTIGGDATSNPNGVLQLGADSGMTAGVTVNMRRVSAAPASSDLIGTISHLGSNLAGTIVEAGRWVTRFTDGTAGAENSASSLWARTAGAMAECLRAVRGTIALPGISTTVPAAGSKELYYVVDPSDTTRGIPYIKL